MSSLAPYLPWLLLMAALTACSAFCSGSEAALFYLNLHERRRFAHGNRAQRTVVRLLETPDRLLSAILFWNLLINLTYFTVNSVVMLDLDRNHQTTAAGIFEVTALLALILFGEVLPKNLGVMRPAFLAAAVALPLAVMVRLVGPLLPGFHWANVLLRRLVWPRFEVEPYLLASDLERAVRLSKCDALLAEQERSALERLVVLSDLRADELMRPRTQLRVFRPPVQLADLQGVEPRSGYLLVSEPDSDDVAAAVSLRRLPRLPAASVERLAQPVAYVPWSTTAAEVLEQLRRQERRVAAVVNEFGETIGAITIEDILDTIVTPQASRSARLLKREALRKVGPGVWQVTGMTSLRRLVRHFDVTWPESKSVSVGGVIQESLERLPAAGDECRWGPFCFKVLETPERGQLLVELTLAPPEETS